jgi:hypothetical protein
MPMDMLVLFIGSGLQGSDIVMHTETGPKVLVSLQSCHVESTVETF